MSWPIGTVTNVEFHLTFKEYLKLVKGQYHKIEKGYRVKKGKFYYYILVPTVCEDLNIVTVSIVLVNPKYDKGIYCVTQKLKALLERVTGNFFQYEKFGEDEA